jgi:hypothetical protein
VQLSKKPTDRLGAAMAVGEHAPTRHQDLDVGTHRLGDFRVLLLPERDGSPNE